MEETFETLVSIFEDLKGIHPDDIYEECSFEELEVFDNDMEELGYQIEQNFKINVVDDDLFYSITNMEELIIYIDKKI